MPDLSDQAEKGEVQEGPSNSSVSSPASNARKRWFIAVATLLALTGVILAIAIPVSRKNDHEKLSIASDEDSNMDGTVQQTAKATADITGYFNSSFSLFGEDITNGYISPDEFKSDLRNVARFLLDSVVKRNLGSEVNNAAGGDLEVEPGVGVAAEGSNSDMRAPDVGDNVNDFGTNNQEDSVEEGDIIVSNGRHVFAVYGDRVVIWDATTGDMLSDIKMPTFDESLNSTKGSAAATSRSDIDFFYSGPFINDLLLDGDRLVVVVGGYGNAMRAAPGAEQPILYDYNGARIVIYDISALDSTGTITQLFSEDINGSYNSMRAIGSNLHIVTMSGLDTYTHLVAPFERWNYPNVTDEEYIAQVQEAAEGKVITKFVEQLASELTFHGKLPDFARISLMQEEFSGGAHERVTYSDGVANSVVQVFSLDLAQDFSILGIGETPFSVSGAFLAPYYGEVYAANGMLIIASNGWGYNSENGISEDYTYILAMALSGPSSTPHSVGTVKGYFLNKNSIDVVGNVLRIATTIQNRWRWLMPEPLIPIDGDGTDGNGTLSRPAVMPEPVQDEPSTENYIIMLQMPGVDGTDPGTMQELSRLQLGKINEVFTAVRFFDNIAYAVTFERTDPFYVLDLNDPSNPEILAEYNITGFSSYLHSMNTDNSLILAIGEEADGDGMPIGLQITVFDVLDPRNPVAVQRHLIENDLDTYSSTDGAWQFKAVRYEKTSQRLIIPVNINNWNDPTSNFNGFIAYYVSATLIEESCRIEHDAGYDVFIDPIFVDPDSNETAVENETLVGPADTIDVAPSDCVYCASLQPRSMIFNGNVMTSSGHFIRSTDLNTCEQAWKLDIAEGESNCCGAWF